MKLWNRWVTAVSIEHLAPTGEQLLSEEEKTHNEEVRNEDVANESNQGIDFQTVPAEENKKTTEHSPRPIRNRRPPIRFGYDHKRCVVTLYICVRTKMNSIETCCVIANKNLIVGGECYSIAIYNVLFSFSSLSIVYICDW